MANLKLCIFGTRTFYNHPEAAKIVDEEISRLQPQIIVTSGDADGICKLAVDKAKQFSIPLELHFLNREKYAAGMYHHRSLEILQNSNYVLFIHDGKSQGTKNEIEMAKKLNIEFKYYKIKPYKEPVKPELSTEEAIKLWQAKKKKLGLQ